MAKKVKYDGVIDAVHFDSNGKLEWVRAYLRRGDVFSDRTIISREKLVEDLASGMKFFTGKRVQYKGNEFEVTEPVNLVQSNGDQYIVVGGTEAEHDDFTGVPLL